MLVNGDYQEVMMEAKTKKNSKVNSRARRKTSRMGASIIPALEARTHFGEIMKRAFNTNESFIVQKSGIDMVVIINAMQYKRFIQAREERFKVLDHIRENLPVVSDQEIEGDIMQAIVEVRKKERA